MSPFTFKDHAPWLLIIALSACPIFLSPAEKLYAQDIDKKAATDKDAKSVTASLFYPDLEPKQLFQILSATYHVQFEGTDSVTGPLSLISKEGEKVDLHGMLNLMNEVLAKQNKTTEITGQIIRIVSVQNMIDETIPLTHAPKDVVKSILETRFMKSGSEETEDKTARPELIEVHPQINAVIVRGPKEIIRTMRDFIQKHIDIPSTQEPPLPKPEPGLKAEPEPEPVPIVKKEITLQHTPPEHIIKFLSEVYLPKNGTSAKDNNKAYLITSHPKLPKIIVEGPVEVVGEIERVVRNELDTAPPKPPVVRKYISLEYIDAVEFAKLMELDETLIDKYKITFAPNNTLIISTTDNDIFPKLDEMKQTFDVDRMEIRYIPLSYADAKSVAELINSIYPPKAPTLPLEVEKARRKLATGERTEPVLSLLDAQEQLAQFGVFDTELANRLSRSISVIAKEELNITPDAKRNALIIRTFSRNFPKILEMIKELDRPLAQVMIDMYITEVTLDDTMQLGVDFTYNHSGDDQFRGEIEQNFTNLFSDSQSGLSYQIISDNITAFIRALQETGNLDIITRPQVTTKNNAKASISLGRDVPTVESTRVSTEGATSSNVKYERVSTTLDVTPQIHPDGFVTLIINQTLDDIGTETFQISTDFNPQVIIRRKAETQLRVKDGQTVCLGGFIGDTIKDDEKKIPLLGDIPLLGEAFKYSSRKRVKTELILFITPHILNTPEELLRMTNEQRSRSEANKRPDRNTNILEPQETLVPPKYRDSGSTKRRPEPVSEEDSPPEAD